MAFQDEFSVHEVADAALDALQHGQAGRRYGPPEALTSKQKAAVMVRLLLSTQVSPGIDRMKPKVQVDLGRTMAGLGPISRATLASVLEEFTARLDGLALTSSSGLSDTLRMLEPHISPIARDELRAEADRRDDSDPWGRLTELTQEQLAPLLGRESATVCAVLLSKIGVAKAAALLRDLPPDRAEVIAHAVALTATISPKLVDRIGQRLVEQIQDQPPSAFATPATDRVGALLNAMPTQARETLLTGLDDRDAGFAKAVRRAIFTFNHIPNRIEPTDVPRILREVEPDIVTTALAAGMESAPLSVEFILSNISRRLADQLRDDVEMAGSPRPDDAEAALSAIIDAIRSLEERGELRLIPITD